MLCNVILSFILVFNDGHKENREKWMSEDIATMFVKNLKDKDFLSKINPPSCCERVESISIKKVPPYDCFHGP